MNIHKIITGPLDVNTYIIHGKATDECAVIDPADGPKVMAFLEKEGLRCTHILLTHGHFDHICGVAAMKNASGATVCIHGDDAEALTDDAVNLAKNSGYAVEPCEADVRLTDGEQIRAAGLTIDVLHTPGHSPGSVCYVVEEHSVIFTGDTLFRLSVGRTDLFRSDESNLGHSIIHKLFALGGDYRLLPGHMRETTLELEREHNRYVKSMRLWA